MPIVANTNIPNYLQIPIGLNLCWLMFEVIRSVSLVYSEGDIVGYIIPQFRKKNRQIPKYRVENRRNTDTAFTSLYNWSRLL